jgi:predicted nucleic acid-binding protein
MKQRIYADTSVFGGYFDEEFIEHSTNLIDQFKAGIRTLIVSDLTLQELETAPKNVKDLYQSIPTAFIEYVTLDEEAKFLANKYIEEEVLTRKSFVDAQHIAIATVNHVDVLVSWNFKHIVNLRRIRLFNATNLKYGYSLIEIRSPREIIDDES